MLVKPTVPELIRKTNKNRYGLVIATAKRARQIGNGSKPMTKQKDISPITLAADEIIEGNIEIYDSEEYQKIQSQNINEE